MTKIGSRPSIFEYDHLNTFRSILIIQDTYFLSGGHIRTNRRVHGSSTEINFLKLVLASLPPSSNARRA